MDGNAKIFIPDVTIKAQLSRYLKSQMVTALVASQLLSGPATASSIVIPKPCYLICRRNVIFRTKGQPKVMPYGAKVVEALILAVV